MKNKKGFTLVEVLAIIAVLGVMVMLIFPNIGGTMSSKKEKELEKLIGIAESAGKAYFSFNDDVYKVNLDTLKNDKYITADMTDPNTGELLDGCVRKILNNEDVFEYHYGDCETIEVPLIVELNGGTPSQTFNEKYEEGTKIELINPTKENAEFEGWKIVRGNSEIKGNTLRIGTTETKIWALWESYSSLEVDLDGGRDNIDYEESYKLGSVIELEEPTKENYKFTGWKVIEGNGIISGNTLTMGTTNTIIKAKWELNVFNLTVDANGGTLSKDYDGEYVVGSTITLEVPTKTGYMFTGWTSTSGEVSGNTFTMGDENVTLTANWKVNTYTISYTLNGGTKGSNAPTSGTYGSIVEVSNPTKADYTFTGWTVSGTGASLSGTNLTIGTGNITLTANWKVNKKYLYNNGNTYSGVTGGWVAAQSSSSADNYTWALTFNSDSIQLISRTNEHDGGVATAWALNLAPYTKLKAIVNTDGASYMYVSSQISHFNVYAYAGISLNSGWQEVTMDISNINSGHIAFLVNGTIARTALIYSVWLE